MSFGRLLLWGMGTALLLQGLAFALDFGWGAALGLGLAGLALGHLLAPGLRATEGRRTGAFLFNLAAVLGDLALDSPHTGALCIVTSAVVVMLLWEEEGPHLRRRVREEWRKRAPRLARPVISLPS
ncbi:hypothetical protein [Deinococcus aestuarii]|uniref:hypothetical protein n=1 Tax=Deinococcus aestuarii TaxID=2774531 RepID=UPI001C0E75D6|nr:hypothetical protein [Deinococcus aestuarii]